MRIDPAWLRPDAFPDAPAGARVELVETHVSWVMLVGDRAYKLKKPVSLGFLDFSTVEERRRACEAELVLNRRLAPDVYLSVEPVTRDAEGRPRVGGDGLPIDFVVRMRRLDERTRADARVESGTLGLADVDALAARVASFHAACRSDAETAAFGAPDAIRFNVEENFAQTGAWRAQAITAREAEEIAEWQRAFLAEHAARFEARAARGFVRDGHGDLRLEHVYFGEAGVTVIDCIEFADRFRFADTCADVAFLSMDLAWHGRTDLAERLLARYAMFANDYDLYGLVDFYEAYRAFVRGKIALIGANDASADAARRERALGEARRYLLLALSADRAALLRPVVVAVGGIIASGKSTLADRVASHLGAPVVEADRTRKHMLGVLPTTRVSGGAWAGAYDLAFTERVYDEVLRRAECVLASGRPVVIDASFRTRAMRASARALAARHGVPLRFVECRVPIDTVRARLGRREREGGVSDARLAILDDFLSKVEPVTELAADEHVVIDTSGTPEQSLGAVERVVATWPERLA